ncbi:MAG: serine/threonine protein kinase [Planctomycetaceae bacterium]|nr:serine/threonine protein kinase [Planctomycetaceae bacterium]
MDTTYLSRLESAFHRIEAAGNDVSKNRILAAISESEPDLVEELRTLLSLKNEQPINQAQSSENIFFNLLLTTLGEGRRSDTSESLLDFLTQNYGGAGNGEIARIRGFEFRKLISSGPNGFVFAGWDENLHRRVAIKVLAPSLATDPDVQKRFIDEARLATSINHPNVIDVYHVSQELKSEVVFFVTEWFEGKTLQYWLDVNKFHQNEIPQRLSIFQELAEGLDAIHEAGIVHCDLKPGNVMINQQGNLKILDFGIAINSASDVQQMMLAGTPLYMAPEQMMGESVSTKTDLFALTEIASVLLTGVHPFLTDNIEDLSRKLLSGSNALAENKSLNFDLLQVLRKGLSLSPDDRFADARELKFAIEKAVGNDCEPLSISLSPAADSELSRNDLKESRTVNRFLPYSVFLVTIVLLLIGSFWLRYGISESGFGAFDTAEDFVAAPGTWVDDERFRNYQEMDFLKFEIGEVSYEDKDRFSDLNPELTRNLGWANFEPGQIWMVMDDLVSAKLYERVMGIDPGQSTTDEPIANIAYSDVKEFCRRLTENCPDGLTYHPLSRNQLCYAAFGKQNLVNNVPIEALSQTFQNLAAKQAIKDQEPSTLPLIEGLYGKYWEWTDGFTVRSASRKGLVDYNARLELPMELDRQIMGGAQSDIFVHRFNMQYGMNDFFHESSNLESKLEADGQTAYLKSTESGQPGWITYRYQFSSPVKKASIRSRLFLLRPSSRGGIDVRMRKQNTGTSLDDCEWKAVLKFPSPAYQSGDNVAPDPIDVTHILAGAIEVEVKYWVLSSENPTYYEQIARTSIPAKVDSVMEFSATLESRSESMRQFCTVPASYRHPLLSFRVMVDMEDSSWP